MLQSNTRYLAGCKGWFYVLHQYVKLLYQLGLTDTVNLAYNRMNAKFQLWREQQVIMAVVNGSWDRRTAEEYMAEFKKLAAPFRGSDWAHLVYLEKWELGVPGIEPVIKELVQWCIQHKLRYVAHIYCPHMVKQYQLNRMIIDDSEVFEKRVYPNQQEAFAWLAAKGFSVQTQDFSHKLQLKPQPL